MAVVTRSLNLETYASANEDFVSVTNITPKIQEAAAGSYIANGTVTVFVPGTTAGLATIEFDEGLLQDYREAWSRLVPRDIVYHHKFLWEENNGFSHVRATLLGQSLTVPVVNMRLTLGQYQQIVFVDFDNRSRTRQIILQFMGDHRT